MTQSATTPESDAPPTSSPSPARSRRRTAISLGSVAGIRIELDYSWFVIFFLILATFSGAVFPEMAPGASNAVYLLMGTAGAVLFFASLLGHELSHSFVARWKGVEVEGITLFVFGGMARTRSEPESPGDEFLIAGVGPLASLLLAGLFWGVTRLVAGTSWGPWVGSVTGHLAFLNLLLAAFNVLPGFPLDGGRLLRAAVWHFGGSYRKASAVATAAGRWLGFGIIALGVAALFLAGQLVGGLWFVFIGWFLVQAANASYRQVLLQEVLRGRTARDAMTPDPETVPPDLSLEALVEQRILRRPYNAFPVTEDGIVVGLVTLSQVKKVPRESWSVTRVADVMTPLADTVIVDPDAPMEEVVQRMAENGTRRVVVAREWEIQGVITAGDITNWLERAGLGASGP